MQIQQLPPKQTWRMIRDRGFCLPTSIASPAHAPVYPSACHGLRMVQLRRRAIHLRIFNDVNQCPRGLFRQHAHITSIRKPRGCGYQTFRCGCGHSDVQQLCTQQIQNLLHSTCRQFCNLGTFGKVYHTVNYVKFFLEGTTMLFHLNISNFTFQIP